MHPLLQPACVSIDVNPTSPVAFIATVYASHPDRYPRPGWVSVNRAVERAILFNPCSLRDVASLIINRHIEDRWLPRN